ncbi:acyltransferase family protein [Geodermatophilus sp. SYSU D01106]
MPSPATRSRTRLDSLTGLRFLAAFVVFAFHSLHYGRQSLGDALFLAGTTGVSFFFIVSGVVMSWTARPGDRARDFYQRRFARIYPAYAVAWASSLVVMVAQQRTPGLVDLLPLTLTQSWVPSDTVYWAANAVFWSLSCEAFFYLAFPVLHRWAVRLSTAAAVSCLLAVVGLVELLAVATASRAGDATVYWATAVFPLTRLAEFVVGMLLGLLLTRGVTRTVPLWSASGIALAAFLVASHVPDGYRDVAVTLLPFALLIWAAAQADLAGRRSPFRSRTLVVLGTWSYAFYLVHTQAMTGWFEALDRLGVDKDTIRGPALLLAVAGAFCCALAGAWALHRFVEVPMERRLRPASSAGRVSVSTEAPAEPTAQLPEQDVSDAPRPS